MVVVDGVVVIDRWIWCSDTPARRKSYDGQTKCTKILYDSVLPVHHLKPVTTI